MFANAAPSGTSEQHQPRSRLGQKDWLWGLFLVALVLMAYVRVFTAGFIWDDESHLTQNPCIIGPLGLKEIWTSARAVYYPLVLTTFWSLHKLVGLSPLPYHILNVLMHAGSAALLWRVLRQLDVRGAWLGAALWALHPVMVQSVAWVTELKNTQSCLFYLLSIFWFLNWESCSRRPMGDARASHPPSRRYDVAGSEAGTGKRGEGMKFEAAETSDRVRWWRFACALLFFVMAILSKPSTVMLPAVLALCVWWRRGRIQWRDIVTLAPFALISGLASMWTIWEQKFHSGATGLEWGQMWPERLIIAGRATWFYLGKLIWPDPLIFIYPRGEINALQPAAYLPLLAALAALVALWVIRGKWSRSVFFAAAYFVISLFPVLGFFSVYFFRYSFVSDHFQYLASMGPFALAGASITAGTDSLKWKHFLRPAVCGILLLLLGFLTWRQSAIYHDLVTLYTATLAKNPSCWMAHYNLGIALRDEGETDEAIAHYRQAVALRPNYAEAHYNLGRALAEKGEVDDAIAHYERALAINPADAEAHNNLGATLFINGRVDDAITHYQKALATRPDYADASCNLANALLSKGDMDGAIVRYMACLALSPNQAEAQYNLASALLRKGRTNEAIDHYQKTLELRPENADAHANLGSAFLAKDRIQDAIAQYRDALAIAPENVAAQSNLAWLLATSADASLRNGPEAVLLAEQAGRHSGANRPVILRILAAAYAEAGRFAAATETAQQALQLSSGQDNTFLADALRKEIALYQSGLPYHKESR
jgi:tetratricopeptide (TPR) repeat protein